MDFIANNGTSIICFRGFSKAIMGEFIRAINKIKGTNYQQIKFLNDADRMNYERNLIAKNAKIRELRNKLEKMDEVTYEDYIKVSNSIFGRKRQESHQKIIKKLG